MMKKLLVLALVLSMASVASAALQLSINGNKTMSEITITASDNLNLDVWTNADIQMLAGWDFLLVCTSNGAIDYHTGNKVHPDSGVGFNKLGNAHWFLGTSSGILPVSEEGLGGYAWGMDEQTDENGDPLPSIATGSVLLDQYAFHCEAEGDVTIKLYTVNTAYTALALRDTAVIHQLIPEPITLTLLGLGGLFLRRRIR